jgi:hypothetical protein
VSRHRSFSFGRRGRRSALVQCPVWDAMRLVDKNQARIEHSGRMGRVFLGSPLPPGRDQDFSRPRRPLLCDARLLPASERLKVLRGVAGEARPGGPWPVCELFLAQEPLSNQPDAARLLV